MLGTYSLPIPSTNSVDFPTWAGYTTSGGQSLASTGIVIPAGVYYRLRVAGAVTVTPNPDHVSAYPGESYPEAGSYGPGGTGRGYWDLLVLLQVVNTDGSGNTLVSFQNVQTGQAAPDSAQTNIFYAHKEMEVRAGRVGLGGVRGGSPPTGLYALSSAQEVTVEQVTDVVQVVANPSRVRPSQQVTFTASRDDGGSLNINSWHWEPDPGQPGSASNPCWWLNPCQTNPQGSGTMTVYTTVGAASAHVVVYTSFTLDANKSIAFADDTVLFTPKLDGVQTTVARWRWVPDSVYVESACSDGTDHCEKIMRHSGTMWAHLSSTPGQGDSASKHVTVQIRCPTNDPILDQYEVRSALAFLWESNHTAAPEFRREQSAITYTNTPTGEFTFQFDLDPTHGSPCSTVVPMPQIPANSTISAILHPHPLESDSLPPYSPPCNRSGSWGKGGHSLSPRDDTTAYNSGVPVFAIDVDSIYRTDGPGQRSAWGREIDGCKLLPPKILNRRPEPVHLLPLNQRTGNSK